MADEEQRGVLNSAELFARMKRTEDSFARRSVERQRAVAARVEGQPLEAEDPLRRARRYVNLGQQPISESEKQLAFERILGTNDMVGVAFVERMLRAIAATGRIVIRTPDGRGGFGTGFLVAPGLLLTNNHVLPSDSIASLSRVQFDYEERDGGLLVDPVDFPLRPDIFFVTDLALDYTLVGVGEKNGAGTLLSRYGFLPLIEREGKIAINEPMNIIQHPNGERKRLAIRENLLIDVLPDFLHYQSDTAPGSSGSPVFSDMWEVVALHHSGVPKRNQAGEILTRTNTVWRPEMGEDAIAWLSNEGVRVSRILATLKTAPLKPSQEDMRKLALTANTIKVEAAPGRPSGVVPASAATGAPVVNPDGSVTWVLPLVVTLGLGIPGIGAGAVPTPIPGAPLAPGGSAGPAPTRPETDPEVAQALAEFEQARSEPYYDEAADRTDRARYYAGVGTGSAPSAAQLSALLETTHTTKVRYDSGRSIYPKADLHPDGKLRSIYSGVSFDPREAIREVVMIDRAVRAVEANIAEGRFTESAGLEQIDLLEASSVFNCEHVVPQSWFQRKEPMRGDMHHLFACGSRCNSFRGNTPYFDFADFREAIMDDCGKRDSLAPNGTGFEPNIGKGAVARATLYFLLRYPETVPTSFMPAARVAILVQWSKSHPPDVYERHRNRTIFQRQGNRNPLVDFPQWVDGIDFATLLRGA